MLFFRTPLTLASHCAIYIYIYLAFFHASSALAHRVSHCTQCCLTCFAFFLASSAPAHFRLSHRTLHLFCILPHVIHARTPHLASHSALFCDLPRVMVSCTLRNICTDTLHLALPSLRSAIHICTRHLFRDLHRVMFKRNTLIYAPFFVRITQFLHKF